MERGNRPALLIVDVQRGFDDPDWGCRNNLDAEARIEELLAAWRLMNAPVLHVHHASPAADGRFRIETPGHLPKPEASPIAGEPVYVKRVNSAFIGTSLEADLRRDLVTDLVIVGLTTNHCVSTTARMAGNLGFRTRVVSDATAAFARRGLDGCMRPAAEVHASALSDLHEEFAEVTESRSVMRAMLSSF